MDQNGGGGGGTVGNNNLSSTQSIADYLAQLLKDKKQLSAFPNVFLHVERLLDDGKNDKPLALGDVISYLHRWQPRHSGRKLALLDFVDFFLPPNIVLNVLRGPAGVDEEREMGNEHGEIEAEMAIAVCPALSFGLTFKVQRKQGSLSPRGSGWVATWEGLARC